MAQSSKKQGSYEPEGEIDRGGTRECRCQCGMLLESGTGFLPGSQDVPRDAVATVSVKYVLGSNTGARCGLESVRVGGAARPAGVIDVVAVDPNGNYVQVLGVAVGTATLTVVSDSARARCLTEAGLTHDVECGRSIMEINVI